MFKNIGNDIARFTNGVDEHKSYDLRGIRTRSLLLKQKTDSVCWTCMSGRCMLEFHKISCWMGRCNCHFNANLKISFTTCCRTYTSNNPTYTVCFLWSDSHPSKSKFINSENVVLFLDPEHWTKVPPDLFYGEICWTKLSFPTFHTVMTLWDTLIENRARTSMQFLVFFCWKII
jgi:hypothetical protein